MKAAITAISNDIFSRFDRRFGLAPWFLVWDTVSREGYFLRNDSATAATGAGIGAVELLHSEGVHRVFSADFGHEAAIHLRKAGIAMFLLRDDGLNLAEILKVKERNLTIRSNDL